MAQTAKHILVTGTNSGLGLGICTRLLDDFLKSPDRTTSLTLIFTTRSTSKGSDTLLNLQTHLSQNHSTQAQQRIRLQPENVELTDLLSIRTLARRLLASEIPQLDAIILNAGIGGWSGLNWPMAVRDVLTNMVANTTWPNFKLGIAGLITQPQFPRTTPAKTIQEPPLGQVFCANVFGHYMLVHWLMPLLCACQTQAPGRIIWVGSIEPQERHFREADLMGLTTTASYESSKRLTDLLALTCDREATKNTVQEFTTMKNDTNKRKALSEPTMHVAHPGICTTSIVALYWIVQQAYVLAIYMARWIGSPWATVSTYVAAMCFTWLALAPSDEIRDQEKQFGNGGRVKWGTAVDRLGTPTVRPTEVQGWGINGSSDMYKATWWGGGWGRAPGAKDAKRKDVDEFVAKGGRVWKEMETLRKEWEERIEEFDRVQSGKRQ